MKSKTLKHGFYPLVLSMAMGLGSAQAASEMVVVGYGGAGQSPGCGVLPAVQRGGSKQGDPERIQR
jgi:hypothetical protein